MKSNYKYTGLFLLLSLAVSLSSCKDNDTEGTPALSTNSPEIVTETEITRQELLETEFGKDNSGINGVYINIQDSINQLMRAANEAAIQSMADKEGGNNGSGSANSWSCDTMLITYNSIDGNGNTIRVSGRLSLPMINGSFAPVKNLLLSCHATAVGKLSTSQFKCRTADYMAVLEPDYIGFNYTGGKSQTYLCQKLIARNCADMIPAALAVMKSKGVTPEKGYGTYIIGYSQGGGNALATGRYLQEEASDELRTMANVKKISCGAGPYDPYATFNHWLSSDSMSMSLVLPLVVKGMMEGHPDIMSGIQLRSYFSDQYLSTGAVDAIDMNKLNFMSMLTVDVSPVMADANMGVSGVGLYWMKFSKIMSAECANPTSHIRLALEKCLKDEIVNDWVPNVPVEIYSAPKDNVIPCAANAIATYDKFKAAGANVKLTLGVSFFDHLTGQINWTYLINCEKAYK